MNFLSLQFVLSCLLAAASAAPAYVAATYPIGTVPQYGDLTIPSISPLPYGYSVQSPSYRQYVVPQSTVYGSSLAYPYAAASPIQYGTAVVRSTPVVTRTAYTRTLPINSGWAW